MKKKVLTTSFRPNHAAMLQPWGVKSDLCVNLHADLGLDNGRKRGVLYPPGPSGTGRTSIASGNFLPILQKMAGKSKVTLW
jgi:hypothetical protein